MSTENTAPNNLLKVGKPKMYQGSYRSEVDEPETIPATQSAEPGANPSDPPATPANGPELSPEEKVYKTRYDSLKAHYDKMINESRSRETELKAQLAQSALTTKAMPKSVEELNAWRSQYPDLYGMLLTVVRSEYKEREDALNERISKVEATSAEAKRAKAEAALMRLHPDLQELLVSQDFHNWVKEQPLDIQKGLYENTDDYLLAARYIDLYKADRATKQAKERQPKQGNVRQAAQAINIPNQVVDPDLPQGKQWKTSDIRKLTPRQFEAAEAEIESARKAGKLIVDV